jgi:ATP-dependent DNA ligase
MLVKCRGVEAKYLVRGLLKGKLRIGVAKMTVLVSLAHAVVTQPPAAVTAAVKVSSIFNVTSSSGLVCTIYSTSTSARALCFIIYSGELGSATYLCICSM